MGAQPMSLVGKDDLAELVFYRGALAPLSSLKILPWKKRRKEWMTTDHHELVTKADGSIIKYPTEPKKTTQLPLVLTLGPELKGATAVCYDQRVGMEEPRRTNVPTGAPALTLTKHTSMVKIHIKGDAITCESDAFDINDECSDVGEVLH